MNPNSFLFIRVYEPSFYICMAENEIKFYVGRRHKIVSDEEVVPLLTCSGIHIVFVF